MTAVLHAESTETKKHRKLKKSKAEPEEEKSNVVGGVYV